MQQISFSKSNKKWTINCLICYLNLALLPIIIPLATKYAVTLIYDFYNLKIVSKNISAEYKKTNVWILASFPRVGLHILKSHVRNILC